MHLHTVEGDAYADFSGAECVKMYHDAGYDGMVVTNHYEARFFDWFKDDLEDADHRGIIDRFLRGYYNARNEGEKLGFTVLPGVEVRFSELRYTTVRSGDFVIILLKSFPSITKNR